jgi:hypothetical protein
LPVGAEVGRRPVDDDRTDDELLLDQPLGEETGLVDRVDTWRCHQHESSGLAVQQLDDLVGPIPEACLHPVERLEEREGVGEHFGADHLADRSQQRLSSDAEHTKPAPWASSSA